MLFSNSISLFSTNKQLQNLQSVDNITRDTIKNSVNIGTFTPPANSLTKVATIAQQLGGGQSSILQIPLLLTDYNYVLLDIESVTSSNSGKLYLDFLNSANSRPSNRGQYGDGFVTVNTAYTVVNPTSLTISLPHTTMAATIPSTMAGTVKIFYSSVHNRTYSFVDLVAFHSSGDGSILKELSRYSSNNSMDWVNYLRLFINDGSTRTIRGNLYGVLV